MIYEPSIECSSPQALEQLQGMRLRQMVDENFATIPFYRTRLRAANRNKGTDGMSNKELLYLLERVPVMGKDEYRFVDREIIPRIDKKMFFIDSTSGSTGTPKSRFCTALDDIHDTSLCTRAFASFGISSSDRVLTFDLADLTYYTQFTKAMQDLGVINSFFYSARSDFVTSMREAFRCRPTVIIAMPSILKRCLDSFLKEIAASPGLRTVVYFGEPLEEDIRRFFKERFGIACYSLYGSTDVG
ncbi:MAG: AMP-binding protein, partial [Chitinivibrionales bacterium]|nr:AMP-binding protein [Chitinivibrionales bacterium]